MTSGKIMTKSRFAGPAGLAVAVWRRIPGPAGHDGLCRQPGRLPALQVAMHQRIWQMPPSRTASHPVFRSRAGPN